MRTAAQIEQSDKRRAEIGARLGELRRFFDVGQLDIAKSISITPQRWHNYEKGRRPLDIDVVVELCERWEVNETWLLRGKGPITTRQR